MAKADQSRVIASIRRTRVNMARLREELIDLSDYLDVLGARARDMGKPRFSHEEIANRYNGQ